MAVERVFVCLVLSLLCTELTTESFSSYILFGLYMRAEHNCVVFCSQIFLDKEFLIVKVHNLSNYFGNAVRYNKSSATLHCVRCLLFLDFLPASFHQRTRARWATWLTLLLQAAGDIQLNPGPAICLHCNGQPDLDTSLRRVSTVVTANNGHCLIYAISISMKAFMRINLPYTTIVNNIRDELLSYPGKYQPFINAVVSKLTCHALQHLELLLTPTNCVFLNALIFLSIIPEDHLRHVTLF